MNRALARRRGRTASSNFRKLMSGALTDGVNGYSLTPSTGISRARA
jgi:hypothetical protein